MTRTTHTIRNVRIGVAWHGRIIHEEILDRRVDVSVGLRPDATVQLSAKECPDAPDFLPLLRLHQGRYYLPLPEDPLARVSLRGETTPRQAERVGDARLVLVDDLPGGSLSQGALTLLFQFVHADVAPQVTREQIVLRLGLVHDERLITDRVFADEKRVSVGWNKNLDIVLPDDDYRGAPVAFTRSRNGSFALVVDAQQDVRLAVDSDPQTLAQFADKGHAKRHGQTLTCPLPLGSRGRVLLGAHTLLFQVVKQSTTVPSPRARSLAERLTAPFVHEPIWTTSLLIAVVLIGALVGQSLLYQRTRGQFLANVPPQEVADNHLIEIDIAEKEPPPKPDEKPLDTPTPDDAQPAPLTPPTHAEPHKSRNDAHPERTQPRVEGDAAPRNSRALDNSVATALRDHNGAAVRIFQDDPTADARAERRFGGTPSDEVGGPGHVGLDIVDSHVAGRSAERIVAKKVDLGPRDPEVIRTVQEKKREPIIKLPPTEGPEDEGGLKEQIARKIASRANAVKGCYEAALRDNPDVGGKIRVNFTVGTAGTVTEVQVVGAVGGLADCIEAKFRGIRGLPLLPEARGYKQTFLLQQD